MKNIIITAFLILGMGFATVAQDKSSEPFILIEYEDEFGDKTGDKALAATLHGTFSNSAASNRCLYVFLYLTEYKGGYYFNYKLYEYCNAPSEKGGKYKDAGRIKMKINDQIFEFPVSSFCSTGMTFNGKTSKTTKKMVNAICTAKNSFPVVLKWDNSTYKFKINPLKFEELLPSIGYIK